MKTFHLFLIIVLLGLNKVHSQAVIKPDFIYKRNNTILEAAIDSVYADYIQYKLFGQPDGSFRKVYVKEVSKIIFADGTIKEFSAIQAIDTSANLVEQIQDDPIPAPKPELTVNGSDNVKGFSVIGVNAGAEFSYYPDFLNKSWSDKESGFALDYTYGVSIRFDFRPVKIVALSIQAGYSAFKLDRLYKPEDDLTSETLYSETQTFDQIPLSAGIKFYLKNGFYLMPEAGITLINTKVTTSAEHPTPDVDGSYNTKPVHYGIGVGVEINTKGSIFFDLSFRYQYLDIKGFNVTALSQTYNKPLGSASVRIGIGFHTMKH